MELRSATALILVLLLIQNVFQVTATEREEEDLESSGDSEFDSEETVEIPSSYASHLNLTAWGGILHYDNYSENKTTRNYHYHTCHLNYGYIKSFIGSDIQQEVCDFYPGCDELIVVWYTESPPLIYTESLNGTDVVTGILTGMSCLDLS